MLEFDRQSTWWAWLCIIHTAWLYIKLSTAHWCFILLLLKLCSWKEHRSPHNCTHFCALYCRPSTVVLITMFTVTSLHVYIWLFLDLVIEPCTDGKVVLLDGDCDQCHVVHFRCSLCLHCVSSNICHHCMVGYLMFSHAVCVWLLLTVTRCFVLQTAAYEKGPNFKPKVIQTHINVILCNCFLLYNSLQSLCI
jgi:hypothetical protein